MSFLAPLFLFGTLAVGLPLLFHLIRRTTRERTSFGSLMFLQPSPPRLTRRSRLEHLLLLALRCLILCLLALGFARPLIKKPVRNDPSTASTRRTVVLVDTSASMRRANLWSDARDKVQSVLRQAMPGDQIALYTFDREVSPLMTFDQWNAAPPGERATLAADRLAGISPGWVATHLGNALISAAETLAEAGGKSAAGLRQIVLISDLQEGSRLDQLQGYEWPKGIELLVETLAPKHSGNAGLQLVTESEDADPKAAASVRVRVSNSSDSKREQFRVGWAQPNGDNFAGKPLDVYVPPGQSRIVAVPLPQSVKDQRASAGSERIILQGDEEAFDNTIFVIPPATSRLSVVYLGNDSGQDPHQPLYFLERAFQETRRQAVEVVLSPAEKPISEAAVQAAALLVATDAMPEERARVLRTQVAAGQTLLLALKNDATAASLASLVGVDRLKVEEAQLKNYAMLTDIDFRNPLFAPFADPRFSDFTRIHFWKYRRLDPAAIPNSRVLAKFDGEAPAILEVPIGKGRLIVFTSGWQPEDSQFALSTKFVPLLYALLEDSAPGGLLPIQYAVGDVLPLAPFAAGTQSVLSVAAPDGSKLNLAAGETNFSRTMTPGIYTMDSTTRPVRFAVNLDPAESRTAALPSDELERLGAPMARQTPMVAREAGRKALLRNSELENRQKLWRWLIIAAFAVLMIETWLAGKTARGLVNKVPNGMTDPIHNPSPPAGDDGAGVPPVIASASPANEVPPGHAGPGSAGAPTARLSESFAPASTLEVVLQRIGRRRRSLQLWSTLAACWGGVGFAGLLLVFLERRFGLTSTLAAPGIAALGIFFALLFTVRWTRVPTDRRDLALQIEARHAELNGLLLTAVQQPLEEGVQLNYLQQRLVDEAVLHDRKKSWNDAIPNSRLLTAQAAHWLALVLLAAVVWELRVTGGGRPGQSIVNIPDAGITVTPGDASIERGNSLVVLARFPGALPPAVDLVLGSAAEAKRVPLVKSLADPIFGSSVPEVSTSLSYHVEYGGQRTRDFHVTVFEYPRLERADATLTFPDYTTLPPKRIEDTRRLSAVEGSRVDLSLHLNKPVAMARLIARDKARSIIPLLIETNVASASLRQFVLEATKTYELQLVDDEGRTNRVPSQFVFEVLTNRIPEFRLASPRGDLRPSLLEEIPFEGTVWDDFGLQAYGIGYAVPGQETKFLELGRDVPANEKKTFQYLLRLEELKLEPDQLISWFVWADDIAPDGKIRRTMGDLFFGEIRPFEEVFREGPGMEGESQGGQSGQQKSPTSRLAELQKQIISATWKLQREHGTAQPIPANGAPPARPQKSSTMLGRETSNVRLSFTRFRGPMQFAGQIVADENESPPPSASSRKATSVQTKPPTYIDDATVVRDSQAQAIEQAEAASERQRDPRATALWSAAKKEMETALQRLEAVKNSPASLPDALAAEQAAYQALLKLQQHEYQVTRNRNRSQSGGGQAQQMQRQLEQMDLAQSENRYETQRQAQKPQSSERREQLQVMNRLQELARRQQDLNDRLKELQTALQEARTEQEREEIRRRLKRLQEEEQQMLADVDEVRQRMDRPENQSRMADERQQLDQTRNDVQRAAEAAAQGSASQALASGTRAQRQFQQLRDQLRKESSSQFADDLRQMRSDARELARQQDDILKKMDAETSQEHKSLSDSPDRQGAIDQLARQKERMTNLVERATQVSQQADEAEPLLSRQLYDTVRKFTQDTAKNVQQTEDELARRGLMTRSLYDRLKDTSEPDGAKLLELTSEMLRQDFLQPAGQTGQRAKGAIDDLKRGVERATESVLGDDTEALRLAQQELARLTSQLQQEMARGEGGSGRTNQGQRGGLSTEKGETNTLAQGPSSKSQAPDKSQTSNSKSQSSASSELSREQAASGQGGERSGASAEPTDGQQPAPGASRQGQDGGQNQSTQSAQGGGAQNGSAARTGANRGGRNAASAGGGEGGDLSGSLGRDFDRLLNEDGASQSGPLTGENFGPWSDRLRDVEEMVELPDLRNQVAVARERARVLRQEFKHDLKKPDWAVVRLQVMKPLVEVRDRISDELARRESTDALVPIDRDPVPARYSELVRKYYEELGKDKAPRK